MGGLREADKKPGFGYSNNNIGQAEIVFTHQGGCLSDTVVTDFETGEFIDYLPPLKYIVPNFSLINSPIISFEDNDLLDLTNTVQTFTVYDTTLVGDLEIIDSLIYNKRLDFIHRVDPKIVVKDKDGINDFIGDTLYTYNYPEVEGEEPLPPLQRNLKEDPFKWPVFSRRGDSYEYRALIKVFEEYTNADTGDLDSVPSIDGILRVNNEMADVETAEVALTEFNTPNELNFLVYSFRATNPNFLENISIPEYSYTSIIEIDVIRNDGTNISWEPIPISEVPAGGDRKFRGIYLGTSSVGAQFVTEGPEIPEYVLRDPPGGNSFASRTSGTIKKSNSSWGWNFGSTAKTEDKFYVGADFLVGIGVSTATEIANNISTGLSATISGGNSGTQSISATNTQSWTTNSSSNSIGSGSDLYIGQSRNIQYGVSENLVIIPSDLCDEVECIDGFLPAPEGFSYAITYGLAIVPGGYETAFIYTQENILDEQIPNIIELRNAILQSDDRYESQLDISDPNYGKNNDDPIFGNLVSSPDPTQGNYADWQGASYIFTPQTLQDTLTGDSVRFLNNQVMQWEDAIKQNEWEKINIDDQAVRDSLRTLEIEELEEEYSDIISKYDELYGATGAVGVVTYALAVAPIPGTAIAGYATFATTTGTGIAAAELVQDYEEYQLALERIEDKYDQFQATNYSISGGSSFSSSITHESASSSTKLVEYQIGAGIKSIIEAKVNGNGVRFESGLTLQFKSSRDWTDITAESETVSFTLSDPETTDFFSVDVYPSLLGWGPIFKRQAGGQTSCPYEGEETTLFEEPGTILSNTTLQIDKPSITASPTIVTNVPVTEAAVFNLTIGNESESDLERVYQVSLVSSSNPFGAIATIDGNSSITVSVPPGSSVNKVLSIEKGPGSQYDYDDLLFVVTAPCEGFSLSDSVFVSARFIPTCTEVEIVQPEELWVANRSIEDTLTTVISGYDINFFDLEELKLEYKPTNESSWVGLETYYKNVFAPDDNDSLQIPTDQNFIIYDWLVNQLPDGFYDLRARSICTLSENTSTIHSGILDRIRPEPFGLPYPEDGILSPNDNLGIKFNEDIDLGLLSSANFDIRGVLNGTETLHNTSLFLDGDDDFLSVQAGAPLKNRDFTIQVAIRRLGTGAETILAQGQDQGEEILLGINDSDQLIFRINGETVTSSFTIDEDIWHYIGLSYSFENETAQMYLANQSFTAAVINTGDTQLFSNYEGSGRLVIGRKDYGNPAFFGGNIHELRIWDRALSLQEFSVTMNKILSKNEPGLLYNWRMDELEGIIAEDHVRRRDAVINGAQWVVTPSGFSASLDGISNYIDVASTQVVISDDMNFTLEFWFRGDNPNGDEETLFSNGSGNGMLADSLFSWNITKQSDGSLVLTHNGLTFALSENDYFDGEWHHLSIILDRNSNITSLIDGNIENSIQSNSFGQLGGVSMYLGARVYSDGSTLIEENFFNGDIDDFRIWNTNRTIEQIKRDRNFRMLGNEPGLLLYLPFESYEEILGIQALEESFIEQISGISENVIPNGTVLTSESPLISIQRPVQSIEYTFTVNEDEIIFNPTSSSAQIENVTLDITVSNVRDLQGNVMASPVTWIAFVDKNQVVWADDQLSFEKPASDELSFSSQIVNQGGAEKAFTVQNVPSWLSVSPSSGSVPPNSSIDVDFEVDPLVNIGDYTQDIQLLTDFDFPERLTIEMKVRETPPDFGFDENDFEVSMGFIGLLEIRGIISTDEEDILIAEVDGEVRGVQQLTYLEDLDRYLAYLNVYSDEPFGEEIKFKIWDASAGVLYSKVSPDDIVFEANQLIGTPLDPQLFSTDFEIEAEIPLAEGWNWFGHYLQNPDSTDFDILFESLSAVSGDLIKGQDEFANFNNSSGWAGPLENTGVRAEEGYKVFLNEADTLLLQGDIIDPSSRVISMDAGWNWIGFISIRNQSIEQALGGLNPNEGDQIKGRANFSVYVNADLGWQGTLNTLVPGESYMYESAVATSFSYPFAGFFKSNTDNPKPLSHEIWQVDYGTFSSNMNAIVTVSDSCETMRKMLLGAFDENGVIRGLAQYDPEPDGRAYLTINGQYGMNLDVHPIVIESGEKLQSIAKMEFVPDELKGSYFEPMVFDAEGSFCVPEIHSAGSNLTVFPTLFESSIQVSFRSVSEDQNARIVIYDLNGRVVRNENVSLIEGINQFELDLSEDRLVSAPYLLRMETVSGSESTKIIKLN
ncbi:MAG: LamG-like jellyroll fold domain-containing protein [Bacteroidota bacterium]